MITPFSTHLNNQNLTGIQKLTYSVTWPVNGDFLKSKGKDFGKSTDPTSILYNGPYLLKALTTKSSIEFTKNENYWDKDHSILIISN